MPSCFPGSKSLPAKQVISRAKGLTTASCAALASGDLGCPALALYKRAIEAKAAPRPSLLTTESEARSNRWTGQARGEPQAGSRRRPVAAWSFVPEDQRAPGLGSRPRSTLQCKRVLRELCGHAALLRQRLRGVSPSGQWQATAGRERRVVIPPDIVKVRI